MPTSFSQDAIRASVSWRTWRVVVQSSILALRPSLTRMPSAPGTQPAASRIDLAFAGSKVAGGWSAKNQAPGEMFVLATWTVPPRSRVLISFLSIANEIAWRIAGSDIGQPVPRSWTVGFVRAGCPADQFGRRNSYGRAGSAETWSPRSWTFGMSESWRSVREVDFAGLVAGDHRVGVAVPLPDQRVEVGRLAGRTGSCSSGSWTRRSSLPGVTESNLNAPLTGSLAMSVGRKPAPAT